MKSKSAFGQLLPPFSLEFRPPTDAKPITGNNAYLRPWPFLAFPIGSSAFTVYTSITQWTDDAKADPIFRTKLAKEGEVTCFAFRVSCIRLKTLR